MCNNCEIEMEIEVVSEEGYEDYEIHTCNNCGKQHMTHGVGADIACCPCEFKGDER